MASIQVHMVTIEQVDLICFQCNEIRILNRQTVNESHCWQCHKAVQHKHVAILHVRVET